MSVLSARPTRGNPEQDALLDDPALIEALADPAGFERLSDEDIRAIRAHRRHARGMAAAAALVLAIGAGGWWHQGTGVLPARTYHFETIRGHHAEVRIADGSTLMLDGATSVDVTLTADRRTVTLLTGEAYFDVAHEAARPFVVRAGSSSAQVLGTAFDLDLARGRVDLKVYRGAVRFGKADASGAGAVVGAGWRSSFAAGKVDEPSRFDSTQQGWREGWLDTDGMRLGDVVEALNRQDGPLVQMPAGALADIRIAGRFRLDQPARLLGAIGEAYGFSVKQDENGVRLDSNIKL